MLEYRLKGEPDWKRAEKPIYFDDAANYRGSIFDLREDSEY